MYSREVLFVWTSNCQYLITKITDKNGMTYWQNKRQLGLQVKKFLDLFWKRGRVVSAPNRSSDSIGYKLPSLSELKIDLYENDM